MKRNIDFEDWASLNIENIRTSWEKEDGSMLAWMRYYWSLRVAFEAGQKHGRTSTD